MKKPHLSILIVAVFAVGLGLCFYPMASSWVNHRNELETVQSFTSDMAAISEQQAEQEKAAVAAYNRSLADSHIVLTDPFDPDAFPVTDGNYEELLAFSNAMASVEIPKIHVNLPIYHGTEASVLSKGVGHLENTSLPLGGESTHTVLSAHTGLPTAKLFTDLDRLEIGDVFYLNVLDERLAYEVDQIKVVEPEDVEDLAIVKGRDYVTLVTCTPYGQNTHRLLVRGTRIDDETAAEITSREISNESFFDRVLSEYGISQSELVILAGVTLLLLVFLGVLTVSIKKQKKRKKAD